jgi:hypothetical protein
VGGRQCRNRDHRDSQGNQNALPLGHENSRPKPHARQKR